MKQLLLLLFIVPFFQLSAQDFPGLDTVIQRITSQTEFLGATILVAKGDKIIHNKGYGLAHPGFNVPASTETKYFVQGPDGNLLSAVVMKFVENKKFSLDDKISKYLPTLPEHYKDITIKQLLTCTSGIMDYHYLGDPFASTLYMPKSRDEAMARFIDMPLTQEPGSGFDWSISNISILGAILEKVDGRPYANILDEFLAPLQLKNTGSLEPGKVISHFTNGYAYDPQSKEYKQLTYSLFSYDPVIRLYSTAEEVFRFCRAIANGTLISRESYALMTSREEAKKNKSDQMGYMIMLSKLGDHEILRNFGGLSGYTGAWCYIPKLDATVIVLSNSYGMTQHAMALNNAISRHLLGLPAQPPPPSFPEVKLEKSKVDAGEAERISGTYYLARTSKISEFARSYNYYRRTVRVFEENGELMIQSLGELPEVMYLQKDGSYRVESSPTSVISFPNPKSADQELVIDHNPYPITDKGKRIGNADVKTFHKGIKP
ncbi:beta-lactamase family protein [Flavihumibacter rivuli]|uniref:serine hydrolase domain-containing protein n=1 Tax=Flavihumibacter rivuli TaxID=2838156 RepID=UPI001BDE5263|nr:serine hydrolase domain-containing protein [Flavihumibacter rivuli]ULQ55492.1 beta-lactamase family protein [Flavihumibacter rivuli]